MACRATNADPRVSVWSVAEGCHSLDSGCTARSLAYPVTEERHSAVAGIIVIGGNVGVECASGNARRRAPVGVAQEPQGRILVSGDTDGHTPHLLGWSLSLSHVYPSFASSASALLYANRGP